MNSSGRRPPRPPKPPIGPKPPRPTRPKAKSSNKASNSIEAKRLLPKPKKKQPAASANKGMKLMPYDISKPKNKKPKLMPYDLTKKNDKGVKLLSQKNAKMVKIKQMRKGSR